MGRGRIPNIFDRDDDNQQDNQQTFGPRDVGRTITRRIIRFDNGIEAVTEETEETITVTPEGGRAETTSRQDMFICRMDGRLLKPTEVCWTDEGQPVCKEHFIVCAYDRCQRTIEPPERHVWFDNGCGKPLPYHRDCARAEEREMRRRELRERDRQTQQAVGDFLLDIGKEWFDWKKPWGGPDKGGRR